MKLGQGGAGMFEGRVGSGQPGATRGGARISVLYHLVDPRHPTHHHGTGCVEYEKSHPWYNWGINEGATRAGQSDFLQSMIVSITINKNRFHNGFQNIPKLQLITIKNWYKLDS